MFSEHRDQVSANHQHPLHKELSRVSRVLGIDSISIVVISHPEPNRKHPWETLKNRSLVNTYVYAHSCSYSEDVYKMASDAKKLLIATDADHAEVLTCMIRKTKK